MERGAGKERGRGSAKGNGIYTRQRLQGVPEPIYPALILMTGENGVAVSPEGEISRGRRSLVTADVNHP